MLKKKKLALVYCGNLKGGWGYGEWWRVEERGREVVIEMFLCIYLVIPGIIENEYIYVGYL